MVSLNKKELERGLVRWMLRWVQLTEQWKESQKVFLLDGETGDRKESMLVWKKVGKTDRTMASKEGEKKVEMLEDKTVYSVEKRWGKPRVPLLVVKKVTLKGKTKDETTVGMSGSA
jgi:hypothetical protein